MQFKYTCKHANKILINKCLKLLLILLVVIYHITLLIFKITHNEF